MRILRNEGRQRPICGRPPRRKVLGSIATAKRETLTGPGALRSGASLIIGPLDRRARTPIYRTGAAAFPQPHPAPISRRNGAILEAVAADEALLQSGSRNALDEEALGMKNITTIGTIAIDEAAIRS